MARRRRSTWPYRGKPERSPEGAFLNLVNWIGNVIAPVGAGLAIAGGLVSYIAGRGVMRYIVTALGCLAVSGVTRLLEFGSSRAAAAFPKGSIGERRTMPPLLYDIVRVLLLLAGPAAFVCLLLAGIALRKEGGTVFWVGGGFSRHMTWAVVFLALEPTLIWFQSLGAPVFFPPGPAIGNSWLASVQSGISTFVSSFVVARIAPIVAGYFVLRSVLDTASGAGPLPSILSAMFLLAISSTHALIDGWSRPLLDLVRARGDVELRRQPYLSDRRRPGRVRGDRVFRVQPRRLPPADRLRRRVPDGERALGSDQPDDVRREWSS